MQIDDSTIPINVITARRDPYEGLTPPPGTTVDFFVRIRTASEANFYQGLTPNGPIGVFLPTYKCFPVGAIVSLGIDLPGRTEPIFASGVVRWWRDRPDDVDMQPGIGIELKALSQKARENILQFMRKRPPLFYDVE